MIRLNYVGNSAIFCSPRIYTQEYILLNYVGNSAIFWLARCSGSTPSLSLSQYIDSSRARQWEYAFSEQIKNREINKSVDWESPKNVHGEGAMRRLIYRYWSHVLLKDGLALEESPNFVNWCDPESDGFMFTTKQEESWTKDHLKLCHLYVEMPKDETPLHEEQNRRSADPSYSWSNVADASRAANADSAPARGSTRTLKPSAKGSSAKGPESKTKALKGTKRGSATSGREVSKKGKVNVGTGECDNLAPMEAGTDVSEAKSSKSNSQNRFSHGLQFAQGVRQILAI